jgi:hypothetical protein
MACEVSVAMVQARRIVTRREGCYLLAAAERQLLAGPGLYQQVFA